MANSLRTKLKKLAHDGKINQQELDDLLKKLDGHDKQIRNKAIGGFAEWLDLMCYLNDGEEMLFKDDVIDDYEKYLKRMEGEQNE